MKLDENIKCPYCEKEKFYIFHYNSETIYCDFCGKMFEIKLETQIKVISSKPKFDCICCDSLFDIKNSNDEFHICSKCGHLNSNTLE